MSGEQRGMTADELRTYQSLVDRGVDPRQARLTALDGVHVDEVRRDSAEGPSGTATTATAEGAPDGQNRPTPERPTRADVGSALTAIAYAILKMPPGSLLGINLQQSNFEGDPRLVADLHVYGDDITPWLDELVDAEHETSRHIAGARDTRHHTVIGRLPGSSRHLALTWVTFPGQHPEATS